MLDAAADDVTLRNWDDVRHSVSSVDNGAGQRALGELCVKRRPKSINKTWLATKLKETQHLHPITA